MFPRSVGVRTRARIVLFCCTLMAPCALAADSHGHDHAAHESHSDKVTLSPGALRRFGITLATAQKIQLARVATVPARVAFNAEAIAHVGTPIEGRALEVFGRLGDDVAKGDLLASIDSPELGLAESEFLQGRSQVEVAESDLEVARVIHEQAKSLRESGSISLAEYLPREAEWKRAASAVKVAKAAALAAENKLRILGRTQEHIDHLAETSTISSCYELFAPIDGRIIERHISPGEMLVTERDSLFIIADVSTLWVLADVPERIASQVVRDTPGRIRMGFDRSAVVPGKVSYIAPALDSRTRTAEARLVVEAEAEIESAGPLPEDPRTHSHAPPTPPAKQPPTDRHDHAHDHDHANEGSHDHEHDHGDERSPQRAQGTHVHEASTTATLVPRAPRVVAFRPGMFGEVEFELAAGAGSGTDLPQLAVPADAIHSYEGRDVVFVPADEPYTFRPQPVGVGSRVGGFVPITSGLRPGDRYVATGAFLLKAELGKEGVAHEH